MTPYLQQRSLYPPQISAPPADNLALVVAIPAYDEPDLLESLRCLYECALPEGGAVEVIVVVNEPEEATEAVAARNRALSEQARKWAATHRRPGLQFFILHHALPSRHAGVGLARKIAMDEACRRLEQAGCSEGVIASFDADSRCDPNYFQAVARHFREYPGCPAAAIYFEHPLQGTGHPLEVYEAILSYELHLRYYVQAQRWAGFPHAFHTVGSSMAVRCSAYQQQGGMNKRKAGEDFYFIHKFTPLTGFANLSTTRVIPSPRPSHRVPFGTGRAVQEIMKGEGRHYRTYPPSSFIELKAFLGQLPAIYHNEAQWEASPVLEEFLRRQGLEQKLSEMKRHSASYSTFCSRFFRWFNAFLVMKYLHFARSRGRADVPVAEAAKWLLEERGQLPEQRDVPGLLARYRAIDRWG
ncbi:MAG: glycosyltransferase [Phaeodactylibacter sp.]|nr:glycosyltransferase [Phaeodactylibacter sp.]